MPNHWLFSITLDNFSISAESGLIGLGYRKHKAAHRIQPGDLASFYIIRKTVEANSEKVQKIKGIARVTGAPDLDDKVIWKPIKEEVFPVRLPVEFLNRTAEADIRPLLSKLSFVKSDLYWGAPLMSGMVPLTAKDWAAIEDALGVTK